MKLTNPKVISGAIFAAGKINGQWKTSVFVKINLTVFQTGLNYAREIRVANRSTIAGSVGLSSHYYLNNFAIQFQPEISLDYKFYYKKNSRKEKGKNISEKSSSFIGAIAFSEIFPLNKLEQSENSNFIFGGAVFWGRRQKIKDSGFQTNFLIGPSIGSAGLSDKNFAIYLKAGISYLF